MLQTQHFRPRFMQIIMVFAPLSARGWALAAFILLALAGCSAQNKPAQPDLLEREVWDACYVQGARVGYLQTAYYRTTEAGRPAVRIEGTIHLTIKRFGQVTKQNLSCTSIETPEGQLIRFQTEMKMGPQSLRASGQVEGKRLNMEIASQGKKTNEVLDWSPEYGGFYALEESLARLPMQPGQERTLHCLISGFNQVATIAMVARDWEQTPLLKGKNKLLHIDTMAIFPNGQQLEQTVWIDRGGEVRKTRSPALDMETFRTTKAEALENSQAAQFDIGLSTTIKLDKPLLNPHETKRVVYRVHLSDGDPAKIFLTTATQNVKSLDTHTAEVTVFAVRPNQPGNADAPADPPTADDREPNNWIQSDDPKIVALAREAAGDADRDWLGFPERKTVPVPLNHWNTAAKLEKFVHDYITEKDFSQAFATAAEVAETRKGDCTEHGVLLAALCRARNIPARVAIGLVYMPAAQAFGYHLWTDVYIDNKNISPLPTNLRSVPGEGQGEGISSFETGAKWIPLDATIAKGGIGADHLLIARSSLKGASAYSSFLPVVQVVGRMKIEVLEAE